MVGKGNEKEKRNKKGNEMTTGRGCQSEFVLSKRCLLESFYMWIRGFATGENHELITSNTLPFL